MVVQNRLKLASATTVLSSLILLSSILLSFAPWNAIMSASAQSFSLTETSTVIGAATVGPTQTVFTVTAAQLGRAPSLLCFGCKKLLIAKGEAGSNVF